MKIIITKDAGYCFGVRDAVNMAYDASEKFGKVYMLGDIVHNENVINDLSKAGATVVKKLDDRKDLTIRLAEQEQWKRKNNKKI